MLQVSNVHKSYGDVTVLEGVSFILNPGERMGLIGPNGCGKSTLLRIIAGEEPPDEGSVRFSPPHLSLGYLPQGQSYEEEETLADFLQVGGTALDAAALQVEQLAAALRAPEGAEMSRLFDAYSEALAELERLSAAETSLHEVEAILAGLGMGDMPLDLPVATLSGGQKTRLGLARMLLHDPQLLLLDEPTNHLDIGALEWLESWLAEYKGAILLVTHSRMILERTVHTILELDQRTHTVRAYAGTFEEYVQAKARERARQLGEGSAVSGVQGSAGARGPDPGRNPAAL